MDGPGKRPTIVQFGAGAIGRGFLGQLWCEAGYETVFVDVNAALMDALNARRSYPLRLLDTAGSRDLTVAPVRAVAVSDASYDTVAEELARCAFACTAVGVGQFELLGASLAGGVARRLASGDPRPLNVICCENQAGAGALLRESITAGLPHDSAVIARLLGTLGCVDASVGRMVPPPTPKLCAEDPLLVAAEPYQELPIDGDAWLGPVPQVPGLLSKRNFGGYVARKLFTHNGGHALLAYEGYLRGHEYIWQAAEDPELVAHLRGFWGETGAALIAEFGFDPAEQRRHEDDLLTRFRNRALGDTVARVGRDPLRKLRPDDRLVGAALLCLRHGREPLHVAGAIAASVGFWAPGDPSVDEVRRLVESGGAAAVLRANGLPDTDDARALLALLTSRL